MSFRHFALATAIGFATVPYAADAQEQAVPASVDYDGFVDLAQEVTLYRQARLLGWQEFWAQANADGAVLLDTRSSEAFAAGHLAGAVNLPFSEFTDEKLAEIIGDTGRPIFIYCNNNFADDVPPIRLKRLELALNIPTFINLYGYGYRNVWELGETVETADVDWVTPS